MDMNSNALERSRSVAAWSCAVATMLLLAVLPLPGFSLFEHGSGLMLGLHLLLEMFSVVVSALVVVIAWHAFKSHDTQYAHTLIFTFTVVAGVDLVHALSYPGMPDLGSPGSTSKAIFFWFMGRGVELLGVWLIALKVRLPGTRWHWQMAAIFAVGVLFVLGTWQLDWFPQTFELGLGVTPFKRYVEWALFLGNLAGAAWFWNHARLTRDSPRLYYFAAACFVMGLGELTFTSYMDPSDFLVIFGHLFKVAAYALIYAGTFMLGMREPYDLLVRSECALRNKQVELNAVLAQVPAGIARLDRNGRYLYVNELLARRLGKPVEEILGQPFEAIVSADRRADVSYHWGRAISGTPSAYEGQTMDDHGRPSYSSAWIAPARGESGEIEGAVAVVIDTTEQHELQQRLLESLNEVADLKTALDAHAIVATTDARGIITSVNDKFCEISKYSRDELLGRTHAIINSGRHPKSFFQELWVTISSGKVWTGEICNRAKDGTLYWVNTTIVPYGEAGGRPVRYVAIRADITERKLIEEHVQKIAYQDALTGLPNRRLLMDRLQQGMAVSGRSGLFGALLLLDLDHFKDVNDTLGHDQGDLLLQEVSQRLISNVRQTDTVARLGGDEFVVLLADLGTDEHEANAQAGRLCEHILHELCEPFQLDRAVVNTSPSIGAVLFHGQHVSPQELLKQADISLYQAKGAGRRTVRFFDPAVQEAFQRRLAAEEDLRGALLSEQFELFYQPIVGLSRHTVAVEVLLRWRHPQRGLVSPADFIPILERTGLIVPVGQWVIEQACAQLQRWRQDPHKARWQVAVNVSAKQFRQPDFVDMVSDALDRHDISLGQLKLEITESSLQENLQETVEKMHQLRAKGVRFAIDDFGTGYSSLAYLKALPIDVLKIDRSFVRHVDSDANDAAISKTVLDLASNMGLEVVAEGVETESQFWALTSQGCTLFQGYLFGKPEPAYTYESQLTQKE